MRFFPRTEDWIVWLPDGFTVFVRRKTFRGNLVTCSLALVKDGECITRYDVAHGFPHRDVIGRKGATIYKETGPYEGLTLKRFFEYADNDLSSNYLKHYEYYEKH
jgi:hypothetical protein